MKAIEIDDLKIFILDDVSAIMKRFRQQDKYHNEAGGILLGQVKDKEVYIMKASTPNSFDKASRYSFERNKQIAQILIDYEFINSGNKTIYLGEWHTHPEPSPTPSGIDKKMIDDQFSKNVLNEPFILLLIQGIDNLYVAKFNGKKLISSLIA